MKHGFDRPAPAWPHPLVRPVGLAALAFLSVGQVVVVHAAMFEAIGRAVRWHIVVRAGVVNLAVWALLLVPVRLLVRRFPLGGEHLWRHLGIHIVAGVAIATMRDVEAADRVLARLAELLRASLRSLQAPEISLREEILLLEPFLEIARTRFRGRLEIEIEVDDSLDDVRVPALVLQPLVENALQHGIALRRAGGRIWIRGRRLATSIELRVEDDGVGPRLPITVPPASSDTTGTEIWTGLAAQ